MRTREGVEHDLDAGAAGDDLMLVHERAGDHARLTSMATALVHDQTPFDRLRERIAHGSRL
jgi:hypothetical protein